MTIKSISLLKKNGYYYLTFTDDNGRRRQKSTHCKNRHDAMQALSEFNQSLADARDRSEQQVRKAVPLSSFTKEFIGFAESTMCKSTARAYRLALRDFGRIIGEIDMSAVTAKHWDLFKTNRLGEKVISRRKFKNADEATIAAEKQRSVTAASVNVGLRHIKAAFSTAARWEVIARNPFDRLPLVSIPKKTPAFLTALDAEKLLGCVQEQWLWDFIVFAINTGMRRGEVLSLRWVDMDTAARKAKITNRADFTTKSGEERVVALNDAAVSVVQRRQSAARSEYVFTDDLGIPLEATRVTHRFKAAVRAAKLSETLHLHSLRHSFASILVGGGTSLFTVSKLLGHANTKTSEIYSHLLPQHLHNEVDKISIGIGNMQF